jgi:hypothetical protein
MYKEIFVVSTIAVVLALGASAGLTLMTAFALPDNSGFGQASSAFGQSAPGAVGDHASSFDNHIGIGNVAGVLENGGDKVAQGTQVGQLGCDLGQTLGFDVC